MMVTIIERELYGVKRTSATRRGKPVEILMPHGYKSSEADAHVWMKRYFNTNGDPYYKYMLIGKP